MSWSDVRLGDCIRLASGGTPSKGNAQLWSGDVPWVSCKDMKLLRLHDTEDHVSRLAIGLGTRLVPAGTILIVVRGMILAKDFPVAEAQRPLTFNQDLKAVTALPGVEARFVLYWLLAHRQLLMSACDEAAHGTKRLQTDRLLGMPVHLPQVATQRRIASILSAYDDLIENNTRRIAILEEMARRIYEEWFVRFRFPGHGDGPRVQTSLGDIPQGWEVRTIADLCESVTYGYTDSASRDEVGPRFLRITDIVPDVIDWVRVPFCAVPKDKVSKYLLRHGDIVVARTGATTGYAKRLNKRHPDTVFASYLVRARAKSGVSNLMLGVLMQSDEYKQFIKANIGGAAQPQANAVVLTSMPLPIPPSSIGKAFDQVVESMIDQAELLAVKNQNLRQTRDLLLPKLISGELDVSTAPTPEALAA